MSKTLLSLFAALIALLALPSCNFDEEKEHHLLNLRYLNADALHLYADQTTDTLTLTATDSWHLDLKYRHADDANHLQLSPTPTNFRPATPRRLPRNSFATSPPTPATACAK